MREVVFLDGCPHCKDGIPALVTMWEYQESDRTNFVGDWPEALLESCLQYPQMRIVACKKIGDEEE